MWMAVSSNFEKALFDALRRAGEERSLQQPLKHMHNTPKWWAETKKKGATQILYVQNVPHSVFRPAIEERRMTVSKIRSEL